MARAQPASVTSSPSLSSKESTEALLSIYAEATGRTVLRPGTMPGKMVSTNLDIPTDTNKAAVKIETVLAENGFEVTRIGESFVRVMPFSASNSAARMALAQIKMPKTEQDRKTRSGEANFPATDIDTILNIYAELKHRTVLRPTALTWALFKLRTQRPVSNTEMIYAMETLLVLNRSRQTLRSQMLRVK
jgi:hypothetical protein